MNCNFCDNEIQILYNNHYDNIKAFHCKECKAAYIFESNKLKHVLHELLCLDLIINDPLYLSFIDNENFNYLATKYINCYIDNIRI